MNGLKLLGHPLHPAVVHFPVAGWTAAVATDVLFVSLGDPLWWQISRWLLAVGVLTALGAMTAGFVDLLAMPPGSPTQRRALRHLYLMASAWTVYAIDLLLRFISPAPRPGPVLGWAVLSLSICGFVLLFAGTHVGAQLVYDLGVGQTGRGSTLPGTATEEKAAGTSGAARSSARAP
ncbi:MAG TPA: DUF2231 domain-containing protein [bacterium]|nr:DUF2231 domain-containing protein [bacterium]